MSAGSVLTKLFILYSIIPLNKWYMTTLWGVGQGLFQAAADTKRSTDAAAQKAKTTATNTALGGVMGAAAYKNAYQGAAMGDKVTAAPGAGGQAGAISKGVAGSAAGGDAVGGIEKYKGALEPSKRSVAAAGLAGAAMGALGVNPRMASGIIGNRGSDAYDRRVGSTAEQRAVAEREVAIDRHNEQNYVSKGYNPDPQDVWYKKNADGSIDRSSLTTENKSGAEGYKLGTYVPFDNNAAISSKENQDILKNRLDSGIETGNHYISDGEIKNGNGDIVNAGSNGILVEHGSRLADANRLVDSRLQDDFKQGLAPGTEEKGWVKTDKNGNPVADSFRTERPEDINGWMGATRTKVSEDLSTDANRIALTQGLDKQGNAFTTDGSSLVTLEGSDKASPAKALNNYQKVADSERESNYDPSATQRMYAKVSSNGRIDTETLRNDISGEADAGSYIPVNVRTVNESSGVQTADQIENAMSSVRSNNPNGSVTLRNNEYLELPASYTPSAKVMSNLDESSKQILYRGQKNGETIYSDKKGKGTGEAVVRYKIKEDSSFKKQSEGTIISTIKADPAKVVVGGKNLVVTPAGLPAANLTKLGNKRPNDNPRPGTEQK